MKRTLLVLVGVFSVIALPVCGETPDARKLVRQSIENYEHDWHEGIKWSYRQTDVMGKGGDTVTEVSEIGPLYGTPYERLISRNGELTPELQKREEEKQAKATRERENETPQQREARIRKFSEDRAFFREIPDAYDFRIVAEPTIEGRPAWEIEMSPRAEYRPKNSRAAMLRHIQGKLWIDKQEVQWVKAEAEVTDTISIGWILARVGPGASFELQQVRVAPNLWLAKKIDVNATAKVLMVHTKDLTEHLTYSDFHLSGTDHDLISKKGLEASGHGYR